MTEMTIQETIWSLEELTKPYLSHLIPIYNRPGIENAITILERVRRLEEMIQIAEGKTCDCGQIHRRVFSGEVLNYLKTGEEF